MILYWGYLNPTANQEENYMLESTIYNSTAGDRIIKSCLISHHFSLSPFIKVLSRYAPTQISRAIDQPRISPVCNRNFLRARTRIDTNNDSVLRAMLIHAKAKLHKTNTPATETPSISIYQQKNTYFIIKSEITTSLNRIRFLLITISP